MQIVKEAEAGVADVKSKIEAEKEKIKAFKKRTKMTRGEKEDDALRDVRKKYCFKLYESVYKYGRERAKQKGWRRPWDGPDGAAFVKYQNEGRDEGNLLKRLAGEGGALPGQDSDDSDSEAEYVFKTGREQEENDPMIAVEHLLKMQAFDWQDTQDMAQYDNDPYEKFSNKFGNRVMAMANGIGKSLTRLASMALDATGL